MRNLLATRKTILPHTASSPPSDADHSRSTTPTLHTLLLPTGQVELTRSTRHNQDMLLLCRADLTRAAPVVDAKVSASNGRLDVREHLEQTP
jgi:hypothetical protein